MSVWYSIKHNDLTFEDKTAVESVTISNGSVLETYTDLYTKTLHCDGKRAANNIIISTASSTKTLHCAGKKIIGDITIYIHADWDIKPLTPEEATALGWTWTET